MRAPLLHLLLAVVFLSSCSPVYTYFSQDLYENEKWTSDDLQRIQFYTSSDIVLTRQIRAGETTIEGGKIEVKNGTRYEKVIIKQGTPGVLVMMPREDRFAISFDAADDEAYLMFGPNPELANRYALLAQEWEQERGIVHYKGIAYTVDAAYAFACLMVDMRKSGQDQFDTHTAGGRTLEQR